MQIFSIVISLLELVEAIIYAFIEIALSLLPISSGKRLITNLISNSINIGDVILIILVFISFIYLFKILLKCKIKSKLLKIFIIITYASSIFLLILFNIYHAISLIIFYLINIFIFLYVTKHQNNILTNNQGE